MSNEFTYRFISNDNLKSQIDILEEKIKNLEKSFKQMNEKLNRIINEN